MPLTLEQVLRGAPYGGDAGGPPSGMTCSKTDGWTESSPVNGPLCAAISTSAIPIPVAKIVRMIRFATRLSLWIMAIVTKVRPPCSSRAVHFTQFTEEPLKMMRWRRAGHRGLRGRRGWREQWTPI